MSREEEPREVFAEPCYIRATHQAAFRHLEWALICGVQLVNLRPCYLVMFDDGKTDLWPTSDPDAGYEFSSKKWRPFHQEANPS